MTSQPETSATATLDHHRAGRPTRLASSARWYSSRRALIVAVGSQPARDAPARPTGADPPAATIGGITTTGPSVSDLDAGDVARRRATTADRDRIRANITFWGDRVKRPRRLRGRPKLGKSRDRARPCDRRPLAYLGAEPSSRPP